jgi:hypothetical protein
LDVINICTLTTNKTNYMRNIYNFFNKQEIYKIKVKYL